MNCYHMVTIIIMYMLLYIQTYNILGFDCDIFFNIFIIFKIKILILEAEIDL